MTGRKITNSSEEGGRIHFLKYLSIMAENEILWEASSKIRHASQLHKFRSWLLANGVDTGTTYEELWQWSVNDPGQFWGMLWDYYQLGPRPSDANLLRGEMPDAMWFEGVELNFCERVFAASNNEHPALVFRSERHQTTEISWQELTKQTARLQKVLKECGVTESETVGAVIPNIPEATYGFLATSALGAVWSSCSPDFGPDSVIDRLRQIEPRVIIAVDGYQYGGKSFDRRDVIKRIADEISSINHIVLIRYLDASATLEDDRVIYWDEIPSNESDQIEFVSVPFSHPLWVLYSSGTTGVPKAITHSHGGILLEHLKYLPLHNDLHRGEKFFWFSTTGWMMWNYIQGALLHGGSVVLYDGSPGFPSLNVLGEFAEVIQLELFGASAPYFVTCMKKGLNPASTYDLGTLRSVSSTGAPLPAEAFEWIYDAVGDVWLCSMSGGTDVCTAFVGGCIEKPVRTGEIQCRALGVSLHAFDEEGHPVIGELGEMVITEPMPSMPIYFWNDEGKKRYRSSYFENYPGVWRHGDWVKLTEEGGLMIFGRSDATLNRQGVRIGTAEIYRALNALDYIKDAMIVHLDQDGQDVMPLFVVMESEVSPEILKEIKQTIRKKCSPRHVPDEVIRVPAVPYTMSGKKMEAPVKKILLGADPENVLNRDAMRNPEAMDFFIDFKL